MPNQFQTARTSAHLWKLLQSDGGLQVDGYDNHLVTQLRDSLQLSGDAPLADQLDTAGISVERFVEAFFTAAAPYVAMWSDLLHLFEQAAATAGQTNLQINYQFGETGGLDLAFDLASFRQSLQIVEAVTARFDLSGDGVLSQLWQLPNLVESTARRPPSGSDEADRFAEACLEPSRPWPDDLPARPSSPEPTLDALLDEAWDLIDLVFTSMRALSTNHQALMALHSDDATAATSGMRAGTLRQLESDFWLPTTVIALTNALSIPENAAFAER
jgi:hypothetical protein